VEATELDPELVAKTVAGLMAPLVMKLVMALISDVYNPPISIPVGRRRGAKQRLTIGRLEIRCSDGTNWRDTSSIRVGRKSFHES